MAVAAPVHQLYPSPLRYPGGKGKLANYIKLIMVTNGLVGTEYVEPYAGGAAVALTLLFEEYADHIHINDVNRSVAAFWRAVVDRTDQLCERIRAARLSVEEWDAQRAVQARRDASDIDLAYSTFYMNRTNRSGIINGGIIGGRDQMGRWLLDARWKPDDLIERIRKIGRFRDRITVTDLDAATYLRNVAPRLSSPFVYLDPPYYRKGRRLYEDYYHHEDHVEIAGLVQALRSPWIVSYDLTSEIRSLYRDWISVAYGLNYTARHRFLGSEIMFFSQHLSVPRASEPRSVKTEAIECVRRSLAASR